MKKAYYRCILLFLIFTCVGIFPQDSKGVLVLNKIKGNEGKRWAACIGINDYHDEGISELKNARNDAKGLASIFTTYGQFDNVYTMTDDLDPKDKYYPSKPNIIRAINYILKMADKKDLIVFSFSGHGIADDKGNCYLVPVDACFEQRFETSFALDYLVKKLKEKKIVVYQHLYIRILKKL